MHEEYEIRLFQIMDYVRERGLEGCFCEDAVEEAIEALEVLASHLPENPEFQNI